MCGIAGSVGWDDAALVERMLSVLVHRGPDGTGVYAADGVAVGACRLAIVDIAGGTQPVANEDGAIRVVFNGEIYNHAALIVELGRLGHRFRSRCDTEVIAHAYEEWGEDCVRHFSGMFAFAVYDARRCRVFLARDPIGIKPLYYWSSGGRLLFASEVKALLEAPVVERRVDETSVARYLVHRYVPGPATLIEHVHALPPGHVARFDGGTLAVRAYWSPPEVSLDHARPADLQAEFDERFDRAVQTWMRGDVPCGAFLSGGLDSNLMVARMVRARSGPVPTFSIGFEGGDDELNAARASAEALGTEHHELVCRASDLKLLPRIVWHADLPLGDPIVLPAFLLAREAAGHVKVVLTGDGADELLGGYFFHRAMLWGRFARRLVGPAVCTAVGAAVARMPVRALDCLFRYPAYLGAMGRVRAAAYARLLAHDDVRAWYEHLRALFTPEELAAATALGAPIGRPMAGETGRDRFVGQMLALQFDDWLPDNVLLRLDRVSMAHGLEARVPYLDQGLVEFLARSPAALKLGMWGDKLAARRYARRVLPLSIARRPKRAFYAPLERYLDTAEFAELERMTLDEARVRRRGYLHPTVVRAVRARARRGEFLAAKQVFALIVLELWHMMYVDRELGAA